ncbi:hypothetical protein, partial [Sandarakinorhabdus sp.]|uniref:hypothetical protein n=1 Tax=Sandarakinorhabdus sp. TaxID=1916663 RepID=UPI003341EC1D
MSYTGTLRYKCWVAGNAWQQIFKKYVFSIPKPVRLGKSGKNRATFAPALWSICEQVQHQGNRMPQTCQPGAAPQTDSPSCACRRFISRSAGAADK